MKKVILMSGLAMLLLASCKKDAPVAPEVPATPPVENPAPPPPPKPQAAVPAPPPAPVEKDGTSVSLDENGVNVSTKKGENDSKVTISKTKKEVKFSTN